jgi:hypothetical protein
LSFLLGAAAPALCLLLGNWWMFGSPFVTSYDRWQHFVNGRSVLSTLRSSFNCSLIERVPKVLLDAQSGLLIGAPLIVVALGYGIRSLWREARQEAALIILICIAEVALYSKFCASFPGSPGNRYLMSVVALLSVPLTMALRNCFHNNSDKPQNGSVTRPAENT